MRMLGMAERALENTCDRVKNRKVFGKTLDKNDHVLINIAKMRIQIESTRLLLLKTAFLMDTLGIKGARNEIAMIKVAAVKTTLNVLDSTIQVFGAEGVGQDSFMAYAWASARTLRIADGPDEVHLTSIAKGELLRNPSSL